MDNRLLRWKQVKEKVPVSRSKWYDGVSKGIYPQPVRHLGPRTSAWKESEIDMVVSGEWPGLHSREEVSHD